MSALTEQISNSPRTPFQNILTGPQAFYNQSNYVTSTRNDFASVNLLPISYSHHTEQKVIRIAKQVLSILIFPIGIYQLLHSLIGKIALLPASTPRIIGRQVNQTHNNRLSILEVEAWRRDTRWKYKRVTVEADGHKIDAMLVGQTHTFGNGRWLLASNGNGDFYEDQLAWGQQIRSILDTVNGNAVVFNYPGVGASAGLPNREGMVKAYKALLTFLEDRENGIGAQEIIGHGYSIGGGVQGEALRTHVLRDDIRYVFVKNRTFSTLSRASAAFIGSKIGPTLGRITGFLVKIFGWNINALESSRSLRVPEIIIQTTHSNSSSDLNDSSNISDDGVITAEASFAKALLDDDTIPKDNKVFIGMAGGTHTSQLTNPRSLACHIDYLLVRQHLPNQSA